MRILKKAREKLKNTNPNAATQSSSSSSSPSMRFNNSSESFNPGSGSAASGSESNLSYAKLLTNAISFAKVNEKSLVEIFFDLEAEMEKSICHDCVSYSSKDIEDGKSNL
jgi:hypothetical protein